MKVASIEMPTLLGIVTARQEIIKYSCTPSIMVVTKELELVLDTDPCTEYFSKVNNAQDYEKGLVGKFMNMIVIRGDRQAIFASE